MYKEDTLLLNLINLIKKKQDRKIITGDGGIGDVKMNNVHKVSISEELLASWRCVGWHNV